MVLDSSISALAHECGFDLAGVASALPHPDAQRYRQWTDSKMAGAMSYLEGRRGDIRSDPRELLPSARSIICVAKIYNGPQPYSTEFNAAECAWISRYAWGDDYHAIVREGLERLDQRLRRPGYESKICVDTAPLLERSYANAAGLGWIGKNTCLINQQAGSWFFLGELLTSLDLSPGTPPPDRCGSCTRCIDACPTSALIPDGAGRYQLDARRCISYLTIELRGPIPEEHQGAMGNHIFGCDICQDVCPWNHQASMTLEPSFAPRLLAPPLERLAAITREEFKTMFRQSAIARSRYEGFRRNLEIAMRNKATRQ